RLGVPGRRDPARVGEPGAGRGAHALGDHRQGRVRTLEVLLVDAFTTTPLAGNPAAVVLHPDPLEPATMRAIAAELARPATAFVGPAPAPDADRGLRWF